MESQKYLNDDGNMDFFSLRGVVGRRRRIKIGKKRERDILFWKIWDGTGWDGIYMVSTGELGRLLSKKKKKKKKGM